MSLPSAFLDRLNDQLPAEEIPVLVETLGGPSPTSVRLHPYKNSDRFAEEQPVGWSAGMGRYLAERPRFSEDPLIFAGAFYVQEAASMFLAHAFQSLVQESANLRMLDLCAAPGGKSTLLLSLAGKESLLVANEMVGKRTSVLLENLVRWGMPGFAVTQNKAEDFGALRGYFDLIAVDAPCSGEGMFRKDRKAVEQWSERLVKGCAITQRHILDEVKDALKPGGLLFYSTCTFAPEEDEQRMAELLDSGDFEPLEVPIESSWGIRETKVEANGMIATGYRFWPHLVKGEGFFFAAFRKTTGNARPLKTKKKGGNLSPLPKKQRAAFETWLEEPAAFDFLDRKGQVFAVPTAFAKEVLALDSALNVWQAGVKMGKLNKNALVPAHELAMSLAASENMPSLELDYAQAVRFLKKEEFAMPEGVPKGWLLARHEGLPLGWLKALPSRLNNHYPSELRLKKDIDLSEYD